MKTKVTTPSAFAEHGLKQSVSDLVEEIQLLYKSDNIPWIVGYSGGKDSTAVLSLVWRAVAGQGDGCFLGAAW